MNQSVRKAVKIMQVISDEANVPVRISTIAERTGIGPSTCAHILEELCVSGLVEQVSRRNGYILGPFLYYMTRYGKYRQQLIQICDPAMRWLHKTTGQTVVLNILCSDFKMIIHHIEGEYPIPQGNQPIMLGDIYCSATGRIILANMSNDKFYKLYTKLGLPTQEQWPGIEDLPSLRNALARIRSKGYAQFNSNDMIYFACNIENEQGVDISLGLTCNSANPDTHKYLTNLKITTQEINRRIAFNDMV